MTRQRGPSVFRCLTQYTSEGWWVRDGWTITPYAAVRGEYHGRSGRREDDPYPEASRRLGEVEAAALASTDEVIVSPVPSPMGRGDWGGHALSPDRGCYLAPSLARVILGTPHDRLVWVSQEAKRFTTSTDIIVALRDGRAVAIVAPCYGKLMKVGVPQ